MQIREIMKAGPVIPVIVIDKLEQAVPLGRALVKGGLPVLEVTLRTPVALEAIRIMAAEVEGAIVGVGSATRPQDIDNALKAGAKFGVSPGLTRELAEAAKQSGMPFLPGTMTPSEVLAARAMGFNALKLFPAQQAGGIGMLKAIGGPISDVVFCPTGGISEKTFRDFLALPNVLCVGGSWVTPKEAVEAGDWDAITRLAAEASGRSIG